MVRIYKNIAALIFTSKLHFACLTIPLKFHSVANIAKNTLTDNNALHITKTKSPE